MTSVNTTTPYKAKATNNSPLVLWEWVGNTDLHGLVKRLAYF